MPSDNSQQYVTFVLNGDQYGVSVSQTREILDGAVVTKVPHSSADMLGVINLRGQVVPVVDMNLKLGLIECSRGQNNCIIIVEVKVDEELFVVGILVDEVKEVLELTRDMIEPPPRLGAKLNTRFIRGMGKVGEHFIVLLDIDHLFGAVKLDQIQAVHEHDDELIPVSLEV